MADRINATQPVVPQTTIQGVPTLSFSTGTADSLRRMAEVTRAVTVGVNQRLDTQAAIDATRAGQIDGGKGILNETLLYAPTIYGQAYTQAATQAYTSKLDMDARFQANRIYAENPNDPEAVAKAMNAYRVGAVAAMPEEMRPGYNLGFGLLQQTMTSKANADFVAVAAAQAEADAIAIQADIERTIGQVAPLVYSSDPAAAQHALTYVGYLRAQIDGLYSSTITDAYGNEVPAFAASDRAKALLQFDSDVAHYGTLGWFQSEVDAGNGDMALLQFKNGGGATFDYTDPDTGEVMSLFAGDALLPKDREALIGDMRQLVAERRAQTTFNQSQQDRFVDKAADNAMLMFATASTWEEQKAILDGYSSLPYADGTTVNSMKALLRSDPGGFSNPRTAAWVNASVATGVDLFTGEPITAEDIFALQQAGALSAEDAGKAMVTLSQTQDKNHYSSKDSWGDAIERLRSVSGLPQAGDLTSWSTTSDLRLQRFNEGRLELQDWAETKIELGEPATDAEIREKAKLIAADILDEASNKTDVLTLWDSSASDPATFVSQLKSGNYTRQEAIAAVMALNEIDIGIEKKRALMAAIAETGGEDGW
jgi:hypothetical protein